MNVFRQQAKIHENPNRNNFDLTFKNHLSMKMGTLYPVMCKPVVPGDSFRIESAFGLRFMPMPFPTQTKMRAHMHFFYVRNKNLWRDFENWIEGLGSYDSSVVNAVHPYISTNDPDFFKTGSLADYLGVPTTYSGVRSHPLPVSFDTLSDAELSGMLASVGDHLDAGVFPFPTLKPYYVNYDLISNYFQYNSGLSFGIINSVAPPARANSVLGYSFVLNRQISNSRVTLGAYTVNSAATPYTVDNIRFAGMLSMDVYCGESDEANLCPLFLGASERSVTFVSGEAILSDSQMFLLNGLIEQYGSVRIVLSGFRDLVVGGETYLFSPYFVTNDKALFYMVMPQISFEVDGYSLTDLSEISGMNPFNAANADNGGVRISALPFRAYESIYYAYYSNSVLQPLLDSNDNPVYNRYNHTVSDGADTTPYHLFTRNWETDFLTSCLPSPQSGNAPLVGMSALGDITIEDENGISTFHATVDSDGSISKVVATSPVASTDHARTAMNIAAVGMNINDFRGTNALQRYLEQKLRSGYRYKDFIFGQFGISPKYAELDMPEFIGGFSRDVQVNAISQTAQISPDSNLGDYAGQATCLGGSKHSINHYCDDYGFVVGIMCVTPTPSYSQLLPHHFLHRDILDYYLPVFSQVGMRPVTYQEVAPVQAFAEYLADNNKKLTDTFGYQRPDWDLVSSVDEIHGLFRTDLNTYLVNRIYSSRPELGRQFLEIDPAETNNIFTYQQENGDTIIGEVVLQVYAKRPVPRVVIPNLGR